MNLHYRTVSLVSSVGGLRKKEECLVSGRICLGMALKRGGIWARAGNSGNPEQTPPPPVSRAWALLVAAFGVTLSESSSSGGHQGFLFSVSSAMNMNLGRGDADRKVLSSLDMGILPWKRKAKSISVSHIQHLKKGTILTQNAALAWVWQWDLAVPLPPVMGICTRWEGRGHPENCSASAIHELYVRVWEWKRISGSNCQRPYSDNYVFHTNMK